MAKSRKYGWVRTALAEAGLMQKDVAKAWGCDVAVISRWIKTGEPKLTWERAQALAEMLGMSIAEFQIRIADGLPPRPGDVARQTARRQPVELPTPTPYEKSDTLEWAMAELRKASDRVQSKLPPGFRVVFKIEQGEPQ
jgi:hypothetical protein